MYIVSHNPYPNVFLFSTISANLARAPSGTRLSCYKREAPTGAVDLGDQICPEIARACPCIPTKHMNCPNQIWHTANQKTSICKHPHPHHKIPFFVEPPLSSDLALSLASRISPFSSIS